MEQSVGALEAPADLPAARTAQDEAVAALARALATLEPPQENQGDDSDQKQQQGSPEEQQRAEGESEEEEQAEREQAAQQAMDPAQLLQEVRDREAQRRRDKARRPAGYETVEKDW